MIDGSDLMRAEPAASPLLFILLASALLGSSALAVAAQEPRPEDTEQWTPEPPVVKPGPALASAPPSDAIVLLGGASLAEWVSTNDGAPARWDLQKGVMTVRKGTGYRI